jgi:hypothetical protein
MSDDVPKPLLGIEELRARTDALEKQLRESNEAARASLVRAELKVEALRAGMVDLDGLKLFDSTALKVSDTGEVDGAAELMARMKREKPWLFTSASSSSPTAASTGGTDAQQARHRDDGGRIPHRTGGVAAQTLRLFRLSFVFNHDAVVRLRTAGAFAIRSS